MWCIAYIAGGYRPFKESLAAMLEGKLNVDTLMVAAAVGAAILGDWVEGAILLFLFSLSGTLEAFATYRTNRSIESLVLLRPRQATRISQATKQDEVVEVVALELGDILRVRPGERFAIDGCVIEGESWVDESTLTGESDPIHKRIGSDVFSGTMNGRGTVSVRMTKAIADTTLERIVHMVHEAQAQKTPTQRFVESWQQPYVIGVFVSAFMVFIAARLVHTASWYDAFYHSMVLLVAASPCAVVVSSPSVMLSAIALAGRHGVLFKGAVHLETLGKVDMIAMDKTGTVTIGRPEVTEVWTTPGTDLTRFLSLAAAVEKQSEHPLAIPVIEEAKKHGIAEQLLELKEFHSVTGLGVHARVDGVWVGIGRESLFETNQVELLPGVLENAQRMRDAGQTALIVVAAEEDIAGVIGVADRLRPEAARTIASLKRLGVREVVLLTGDHERVAQAIAKELGVDEVRAGLLPDGKVTELLRLGKGDRCVAMIGDGVNDAPALATANVGIAMGGAGTDVALEVADVVLMRDDLKGLPLAVWISQIARKRVRQNMVFAFVTIAILVLSTFFELPLWIGVLGHEGSTVLVVLNGLRMLWERVPKFE
jgi:Zn2+/Cd2+-exporting ATPase